MANYPSIVGQCHDTRLRESGRPLQRIVVNVSTEGEYKSRIVDRIDYTGGASSVTTTNKTIRREPTTGAVDLMRLPFPGVEDFAPAPQGYFYLVANDCCCVCRAFVIQTQEDLDQVLANLRGDFGVITVPYQVTQVTTITGLPPDSQVFDESITVGLWSNASAPCKRSPDPVDAAIIAISTVPVFLQNRGYPISSAEVVATGAENYAYGDTAATIYMSGIKPCDANQSYAVSSQLTGEEETISTNTFPGAVETITNTENETVLTVVTIVLSDS